MAVVVDTKDVPPDQRFDLWTEVSAQVFEPLRVTALARGPFSARLVRHRLGPIDVDHMSADASSAARTPGLIRSQDPDQIKLMLQLGGECSIAQDDRASVVRPGQLTSWQSSRPYTVAGRTRFEALIVHCPASLLRPHVDRICAQTAEPIDGGSRIGTVVSHYLTDLVAGLDEDAFDEARQSPLAEGVLDLIRALCCSASSARTPARASRALRSRIDAYVDAHLQDPDLGPEAIARAHFISRSYLNRLFEAEGVGAAIKAKRLDRARRDLADPALAHESVLEIASRWGFSSASHFSRSFRAAYGQRPRDHRPQMAPSA